MERFRGQPAGVDRLVDLYPLFTPRSVVSPRNLICRCPSIGRRNLYRSRMTVFDFPKARGVRQQIASSRVSHSIPHLQRVRPRPGLGSIGTVLVLMGVGMGVLIIRFILVFAHTVLQ
jgi:hypothetical protein